MSDSRSHSRSFSFRGSEMGYERIVLLCFG